MRKLKAIAGIPAVIVLSVLTASALEIMSASPAAAGKGQKADFVFSGSVTVNNIAFEKSAVVMPVTEHNDRSYTDVKLLSKSLYAKIEACFSKGKCSCDVAAPGPKFSVSEVKTLKSKTRVANVSIAFDGDLLVTFGVIKKASGEVWAAYPANFEIRDEILKLQVDKRSWRAIKARPARTKITP
jgi:hypothetical protein